MAVREERCLELLLVDIEALLVGVRWVEAKGDERVDDLFDEGLVDGGAVTLGSDETQEGSRDGWLERLEEVLMPL